MSTQKPCHFRSVSFWVLYIRVHVPVIQQQYVSNKYEHQLVLFFTCPYCRKTPKILGKYISIFYVLLQCDMVYTTEYMITYDTGGWISLRSIHPVRSICWCHIKVSSHNSIPAYYLLRILPSCRAVSHISQINSVLPRPTTEYAPVLTYRQLVLYLVYYMRRPSRSYTCTSFHTFVVHSNELQNLNMADPTLGWRGPS